MEMASDHTVASRNRPIPGSTFPMYAIQPSLNIPCRRTWLNTFPDLAWVLCSRPHSEHDRWEGSLGLTDQPDENNSRQLDGTAKLEARVNQKSLGCTNNLFC
jgi:hypothetical protein